MAGSNQNTSKNPETVGGLKKKSWLEVARSMRNSPPTKVAVDDLPTPQTGILGEKYLEAPELYDEGVEGWRHSLIGRLDFKGLSFHEVKKSLEEQWGFGTDCVQLYAMSRGFFLMRIDRVEHKRRIQYEGPWKIKHIDKGFQKLQIQEWDEHFDPNMVKKTHATVWVQFPDLKVQCWTEKMLLTMGKVLGTPVMVAKQTLAYDFRYPASVLVDIDFSQKIQKRFFVKAGKGRDFWQEVCIPNPDKFCEYCKVVGHDQELCKELKKKIFAADSEKQSPSILENRVSQQQEKQSKSVDGGSRPDHPNMVWVPTGNLIENKWKRKPTTTTDAAVDLSQQEREDMQRAIDNSLLENLARNQGISGNVYLPSSTYLSSPATEDAFEEYGALLDHISIDNDQSDHDHDHDQNQEKSGGGDDNNDTSATDSPSPEPKQGMEGLDTLINTSEQEEHYENRDNDEEATDYTVPVKNSFSGLGENMGNTMSSTGLEKSSSSKNQKNGVGTVSSSGATLLDAALGLFTDDTRHELGHTGHANVSNTSLPSSSSTADDTAEEWQTCGRRTRRSHRPTDEAYKKREELTRLRSERAKQGYQNSKSQRFRANREGRFIPPLPPMTPEAQLREDARNARKAKQKGAKII